MKWRGHLAIPSGSVHFGPHLQTYLNLNLLLSSISKRDASLPVAADPNVHSLHWVALFIFYFNSFPENSTHMQAFPIQQCIYLECKCLCISLPWFCIPLKFFLRFLFPFTDFLKRYLPCWSVLPHFSLTPHSMLFICVPITSLKFLWLNSVWHNFHELLFSLAFIAPHFYGASTPLLNLFLLPTPILQSFL